MNKLLSLIIGISFPILIVELILQLIDRPKSETTIGWKYQGKHPNEINQLNFRGKKIEFSESDSIILLVGDSQSEADAMSFENLPENILQKKLGNKYKVFSLGAAGYGNDQQLLSLLQYFKNYKAHKVILWQTFDNDLWNNTFPTHMPNNGKPKPTFTVSDNKLLYPNDKIGSKINLSKFKLKALLDRILQEGLDDAFESFLPKPYQASYLYKGEYSDILDSDNKHVRNENFKNEKNHYSTRFFPTSFRTKYSIKLTNLILKEIEKTCLKNKAEFHVFNVDLKDYNPKFSQDTTIYKIDDEFYFSSLSNRLRNMDSTNKDLQWSKIPLFIDDWAVSSSDPHLNAKSNGIVMNFVADSLILN